MNRRTRQPIARAVSRRRARRSAIALVVALGLALGSAALAPPAAVAKDNAARKLGRGVANLGLGFLALPREVIDTTRKRGPFVGVTWGTVKGVGMTVATQVVGVWEIFTCPYEFPPDWKPILSPEFPWQELLEREQRPAMRRSPPPRVR